MDERLTCGSLFSGIGLLDYGLALAGLKHSWLCEADEWRRGILRQRWPGRPVHADVRDIGSGAVEPVDVIAGGFPCKGASTAGKRTGFDHPETVLWREMARAVGELQPRYVLVENVANLLVLHDGAVWGEVLGTLAALGYDTVWDCLPAAAVGAPHRRDRVFAVACLADGVARSADGTRDRRPGALVQPRQVERSERPDRDATAAPDAERLADRHRDRPGDMAGPAPADEGEARKRQRVRSDAGRGGEAPADPVRERRQAGQGLHDGEPPDTHVRGRGVGVDWGQYAPAIRRWEAVHGPAPEPLVRRVDDRGAARVERSRLSALGDGVQVQVGRIAGEHIDGLEQERRMRAAV